MTPDLSFVHRFLPAANVASARTLLLLHGTGADENDLLSLGKEFDPTANLLSPRGQVNENGMLRFFRRFPDGTLDTDDVRLRAGHVADFVGEAAALYGFDATRVTAVGYSNGANTAAAMLLLRPGTLAGAVVLRGMLPLPPPDVLPNLKGKRVLIQGGETDTMIPRKGTLQLEEVLRKAGADVTMLWHASGHSLTDDDRTNAREFLR